MGQQWYLHLQGEALGPLVTSVVHSMLRQRRVEPYDFIWSEGMKRWTRICDVTEFSGEIPQYPATPIPVGATTEAEPALRDSVQAPKPAPAPAMTPAPATTPVPAATGVAAPPENFTSAPIKNQDEAWNHKRFSRRVPMEGQVGIPSLGSLPLVNISETGLFVEAASAPPMGTEVKLRILSPCLSTPLEMTGVVIRAGTVLEKIGFAIEFTRVNPAHRRAIIEAIAKTKPG